MYIWLFFIVIHCFVCFANKALQESAMIQSFDPRYIQNPQAFTRRTRRGDSYRTNISATTLHPWSNNVTLTIAYGFKSTGTEFNFEFGVCDTFKHEWLADYIMKYFQLKTTCPIPEGTYSVIGLELPPKGFPIPLPKGEGVLKTAFSLLTDRH